LFTVTNSVRRFWSEDEWEWHVWIMHEPGHNQYCASTGVAPGGGDWPVRRQQKIRGSRWSCAPSGKGSPARRCLQRWEFLRRLAPGGTRPPLGSLEMAEPGGTCPPPDNFDVVALSYWILHAWCTRLLVMLQSWDCWCSLSWARNISLELSLR